MAGPEAAPKRRPLEMLAATVRNLTERRNRATLRSNKEKERSFARVLPSAVTVLTAERVYDQQVHKEGVQIGIGAGWVIASNTHEAIIATNAHVVEGVLRGGQMIVETSGVVDGVQRDDAKQQLEIDESRIYVDPDGYDIAFVPIDLQKYPGLILSAVRLSDISSLPAGKGVMTVGAPHAVEDTLSPDNYIAHNGLQQITVEGRTDWYVQLGGSINHGSSGGMTLDYSYRNPKVVGMVTLGAEEDPTTGYMLPVNTVIKSFQKYLSTRSAASVPARQAAA